MISQVRNFALGTALTACVVGGSLFSSCSKQKSQQEMHQEAQKNINNTKLMIDKMEKYQSAQSAYNRGFITADSLTKVQQELSDVQTQVVSDISESK